MSDVASRPCVLLIAEAANPEWVSVPLIGWSLARALGQIADVHIVTQIRNREAFLRAGLSEGTDFTAIDNEAIARPLWALGKVLRMGEGKGWTALQAVSAAAYPAFERKVWRLFGQDIRTGQYDIVHRITPLSPTIPSPIAKKCAENRVPYVIGPLNGGVPWPVDFKAEQRREREFLAPLRSAYKALPGRRSTLQSARAILAGSRHTGGEIPASFQDKVIYLPENAVDPTRFSQIAAHDSPRMRVAFVGRMVPYKGPDMLIEAALPLLRDARMELDMIGDGPMLEALKAQVKGEDLGNRLRFHGWLPHDVVQDTLAKATLMALPSIREFGGGVVLEAMALGVPPLVVDYAGPGELVRDGLGFKVPLSDRAGIVAGFQAELTQLAGKPDLLRKVGLAGRTHVENSFTWAAKARQIGEVYDWVLGRRPDKPKPI